MEGIINGAYATFVSNCLYKSKQKKAPTLTIWKMVCMCLGFTASQPNGVMSSVVSLPNHAFTRQA